MAGTGKTSERVWVITGANSGLGLAMALLVASRGEKVVGTVRSMSKFPIELKEAGVKPLVVDMNSSDEDIKRAGEEAINIYGHVDVLVNNAGYFVTGAVEETSIDDMRAQFQANFFGVMAFTQAFLPQFRKRRTGHIFNMSSIASMCVYPGLGAYSASKAAFTAISDALAKELSLFNVRVMVIMPGYFSTNIWYGPTTGRHDPENETEKPVTLPSTVYTDPVTQGYDVANEIVKYHITTGQIGDPEKLAQRMWELVTGTGLAQGLVYGQGGKWEWNKVPVGPDCGEYFQKELGLWMENVKAFEPVWRSTDVEPERLKFFPRG